MFDTDLREFLHLIKRAATTPVDPDSLDEVDTELLDRAVVVFDRFCTEWYDLEVTGTENIPAGKALLVGNHNSGITFVEAMGWGARMYREGRMDPIWHGLAHDAMVDMPLVGPFLVRVGALRASHKTAAAAFARGSKVIVFPGGNLEAFRPWSQRHKVVFGGHKGFIRLALRHQTPIVPVVFYGGHNGFIVLRDNKRLAKWIGAKRFFRSDTWPLVLSLPFGVSLGPWFHIPLPVKCTVSMLPAISIDEFSPEDADDPEVVEVIYHRVLNAMQQGMDTSKANYEGTIPSLRRRASRWMSRLNR